jgi:long-subunit fatty acid transport protein
MRNLFLISTCFLTCGIWANAQNVSDGLSFGSSATNGTARFRALSGAMGALGNDLSAVGINPAGSAIFANHFASFSLDINDTSNNTDYQGSLNSSGATDLSVNQAGIVLVFASNNNAVNKFSIGFNYDSSRNYDDNVLLQGVSNTSVSEYFLNNATGLELNNFQLRRGESVSDLYQFLGEEFGLGFGAQQGFLGFQSFIIDPVDPSNTANIDYLSNTGTGSFNQQLRTINEGYQGKFTFNGAFEVDERLSFGLNINTHVVSRERRSDYRESNNNRDATVTDVRFENLLTTEAAGISFQLGTIFKITNSLRAGFAFESPTWYTVDETLSQAVSTSSITAEGAFNEIIAPDIINIYVPYNLRTPGSLSGSLAYIFGNAGLISIDVSSRDYSNLRFTPTDNVLFISNNSFASENLQQAFTFRAGTEIKIKNAFLRGGVIHSESPYENGLVMGDLNGFSLGLGYRWGNTILDVSYSRSEQEYSQQLFDTGLTTTGMINRTLNNVVLTLGFNL